MEEQAETEADTAEVVETGRMKAHSITAPKVRQENYNPNFGSYFTTGNKVDNTVADRIEGKSSYMNYMPSTNIAEQRVETIWRDNLNRDIQRKRNDEELRSTMHDFSQAKSKYEEEIHRKSENLKYGSNFKTRGFVRSAKPRNMDNLEEEFLEKSDGSSLLSDSEVEDLLNESIPEDEGDEGYE